MIISAAARNRAAELLGAHLKDGAGIVALPANERDIEHERHRAVGNGGNALGDEPQTFGGCGIV